MVRRQPTSISSTHKRAFRLGFGLLVVLVPLAYLSESAFVAYYPKLFLLQTGALYFLAVWYLKNRTLSDSHLVDSPLVLPVLLYLGLTVLATFQAVNRVDALVQLSHQIALTLLFFALLNSIRSTDILDLLKPVVGTAAVVSIIGLLQYPGWGLLWIPSSGMPSATLGYRNFAAMYMILCIPVSFRLFLAARSRTGTWSWAISTALMLTFLICTRTRGAWLSLVIACLLAGIITLFFRRSWHKTFSRTHIQAAVTGLVLVVGYTAFTTPQMNDLGLASHSPEKVDLAESVTSIFDEGSDKDRLSIWKNTLSMIADHSLTGVGPGNWQYLYPAYDSGEVVWKGASPRRPHNDYLWIAAQLGLPGLLVFFWIIWLTLSRCLKHIRSQNDFWTPTCLGASLLALLAHATVSFPRERITPSMLFWIFITFIAIQDSEARPPRKTLRHRLQTVQFAGSALILLCLWTTTRAITFDRHHARTIAFSDRQDWSGVLRESTSALQSGVFNPQAYLLRGIAHYSRQNYARAIQDNLRCLEYHPYFNNALNNLGMSYNGLKQHEQALEVLLSLQKLNLKHVEVHANMGVAYQGLQRYDEAIAEFQQALMRNPDQPQFRYSLGIVYEKKGVLDSAAVQYARILESTPENLPVRYRLGTIYQKQDRLKDARQTFQQCIDAHYLPAYYNLGEIYTLQGDAAQAIEAYNTFMKNWNGDPNAVKVIQERIQTLITLPMDH
ncbi:MAG: O-antigen ligase family protein [bacterium]|nr:O-antigen ligase family protein [bacterium]